MIFFRRSPEYDPEFNIPAELRFQLWTSGWRGAFVLLLLTCSVLLVWQGPQAYRELKVWRAGSLIAQSEAARDRGDFKEEAKKLSEATVLLQRHPLTLRAVARYQFAQHQFAALGTYEQLVATGAATAEDKIAFARAAFRFGRPEMANDVIEELKQAPGVNAAAVVTLQAEQALWNGRRPEALALARKAAAGSDDATEISRWLVKSQQREAVAAAGSDDDRVDAQALLARLLLQSPSADKQSMIEGVRLLEGLAQRRDDTGLAALELLTELSMNVPLASQLLRREDVDSLVSAANNHPQAPAALKIRAWNLRFAAEPAKGDEITQEFFKRYRHEESSELRLEAARWLNQRGLHGQALELAEASKFESEDWCLLYLDAVAAAGDWEQVYRILTSKEKPVPLSASVRSMFELRAATKSGRQPDAAAAWRDIRSSVRLESPRIQLYVASYAQQTGMTAEAASIYRRLLDDAPRSSGLQEKFGHRERQACFVGLLRTAGGTMTLKELTALVTKFAEEFPEIDEVQNDSAYLQLLGGVASDQVEATARRLLQKQREMLAYRTTAALSALVRKDAAGAAALYAGWKIDWDTAQDRFKAVYVAVMKATGRNAEAEKVLAGIHADSLRPEERQLAGLP